MTKALLGVAAVCALSGCSSNSPPGASVALEVTLPDSPLARMDDVTLLRAGDAFTLAGYQSGIVRWGRLSLAGVLSGESSFAMATPLVGPVFAATKKAVPGDQLVALAVTASTATAGGYDLVAVVHTLGAPAPGAPVVLATLPSGTDPSKVRLAAGAAFSGNLGFVAWGIQVEGVQIQYLLLSADAAPTSGPNAALEVDRAHGELPAWDCLATNNGPTGLGFSVLYPVQDASKTEWRVAEIDETGGLADMTYQLLAVPTNCHIVGSPTPTGGYDIAFQNANGIGFATYSPPFDPTQNGIVTTYEVAMSPQSFGDPLHQPVPAWTAAAGNDITIGLSRLGGPLVTRFTYDAIPHGARLALRTQSGKTGPVAAWVGPDYVYATYTDQVTAAGVTSTVRYFNKIQSPDKLP